MKKKPKSKLLIYRVLPFDIEIVLYSSRNLNSFQDDLKKNKKAMKILKGYNFKEKEEDNIFGGLSYDPKTYKPLVLAIKIGKNQKYNEGVLIHEITHLVEKIELWGDIEKETELRAYTTEYLFKDFRKLLL